MNEKEPMKGRQQAIAKIGIELTKICTVKKTSNQELKIWHSSNKETKELRKLNWKNAFDDTDIIESEYDVVVHGVSKYDINFERDTSEEIKARIECANHGNICNVLTCDDAVACGTGEQ